MPATTQFYSPSSAFDSADDSFDLLLRMAFSHLLTLSDSGQKQRDLHLLGSEARVVAVER